MIDFVANATQSLGRRKGLGLGLSKVFLTHRQFPLDGGESVPADGLLNAEVFDGGLGRGRPLAQRHQLGLGDEAAFRKLHRIATSPSVLVGQFDQALLVEADHALLPIGLGLEFQTSLLLLGDVLFQLRKPCPELENLLLKSYHRLLPNLDLELGTLGGLASL